ncbi:hypothetical protein M885DRAFT_489082, partial [Pelagophyceae sp. CCMP2097]
SPQTRTSESEGVFWARTEVPCSPGAPLARSAPVSARGSARSRRNCAGPPRARGRRLSARAPFSGPSPPAPPRTSPRRPAERGPAERVKFPTDARQPSIRRLPSSARSR